MLWGFHLLNYRFRCFTYFYSQASLLSCSQLLCTISIIWFESFLSWLTIFDFAISLIYNLRWLIQFLIFGFDYYIAQVVNITRIERIIHYSFVYLYN